MSKKKNKEIALAREFMDVMSVFLERTYSIYETTTKEAKAWCTFYEPIDL